LLEEAVTAYKEIKSTEVRDSFSVELVEVATRVLAGIQLEKTASMLESEEKITRLKHADEFSIDSKSIALANISRMKEFANVEKL
jgi:acyl-CoA dehydrogenase